MLSGLHQAFSALGGVPRTVLFDRMRTAVAGAAPDGSALFNAEMLRFAAHYGFQPRACRPYRPKTKGKVERAVSYLRQSFFYGRAFRDLEDLNAQVTAWLTATANARIHGTTREVPATRLVTERTHLRLVPTAPYIPLITLGRRISHDGFVAYNGNTYSVPAGLTHAAVDVQATLTELRLYQDGKRVALHPLLAGRGQRRRDPAHHVPPPTTVRPAEQPALWAHALIEVERRSLDVYEEVLR